MIKYLSGKKTYLLATLAVIYAVAGYFTGNLDAKSALDIIWVALTTGAVRAAIAK